MSKQWQVVDEHGDVVDQDDTSSIGSDWSFMQLDGNSPSPSRSPSPTNILRFSPVPDAEDSSQVERRHPSLPNSLDSPIRQDPDDRPVATAAARPVARAHRTNQAIADHIEKSILPDPVESRQASARWNAVNRHRRSHRSNQNVDAQRAKCLRRGPQTSTGFQRKQVRLMSGGQVPQKRSGN